MWRILRDLFCLAHIPPQIYQKKIYRFYVEAKVVKNGKAKKIVVFKYKAKKNEKKKMGHRQPYTKVEITKIAL